MSEMNLKCVKVKLSHYKPWRRLGREDVYFLLARNLGTHCTGGWVGPRAGLDAEIRGKISLPLSEIDPWSSSA
jgi:hypothetical protein